MPRIATIAGLGLAAALTLAACGGASSTSAPAASTTPAATAVPGVASAAPTASTASGATAKINANTASQAELEAAFAAAGISNASKWAREVAEYRPYEADPTWAQLRKELGKYNIDPAVLEQIIALLEV